MDDLVWLCAPWPRVRGQGQRSYDLSKMINGFARLKTASFKLLLIVIFWYACCTKTLTNSCSYACSSQLLACVMSCLLINEHLIWLILTLASSLFVCPTFMHTPKSMQIERQHYRQPALVSQRRSPTPHFGRAHPRGYDTQIRNWQRFLYDAATLNINRTFKKEHITRWDAWTWRYVSSYLFTTKYDATVVPEYFLSRPNAYLLHIWWFTKSTFRVSLLSTFRVPSINYSLVCSLPIHKWSSANVEGPQAHCQLNSCKMLHKCSTDCIWKGLQPVNDLEDHSMSSPLLPFDRPYTIFIGLLLLLYLYCAPFSRY